MSLVSWVRSQLRNLFFVTSIIWATLGIASISFLAQTDQENWRLRAEAWLQQAVFHSENSSIRELEHSSALFVEDFSGTTFEIRQKPAQDQAWTFPASYGSKRPNRFGVKKIEQNAGNFRITISTPKKSIFVKTTLFLFSYLFASAVLIIATFFAIRRSARFTQKELQKIRRPDISSKFSELNQLQTSIDVLSQENQLLSVDADLGRSFSKIAHDLRAPIGTLNFLAQSSAITSEEKELLEMTSDRIRFLAEGVLSERKNSSIHRRIRLLRTSLQIEGESLNKKIQIEVDLESLTALPANELHELLSHLTNLGLNSVEAVGLNGYVGIKSMFTPARLEVFVVDTGGGLPENVLKSMRIGHRVVSQKEGGNGIALNEFSSWLRKNDLNFDSKISKCERYGRLHTLSFSIPLPRPVPGSFSTSHDNLPSELSTSIS